MKLIHTLLLFIRQNEEMEDISLLAQCLSSLEKSMHKTVVIYNQGLWDNKRVEDFVNNFQLNAIIIGGAENVGIVAGRQACFEYIWKKYPETEYISELHLDMVFTHNWEEPLIQYLEEFDEPVVGCGVVDRKGNLLYTDRHVGLMPENISERDVFFESLKQDIVVHGFTHPCIHKSRILKEIGGFDTRLLVGKHCFEDDSCLLGYYYYYGTKADWKPKVCYKSVVYHATEQQRYSTGEMIWVNFNGLLKQYGVMGILRLSEIHANVLSKQFFKGEYDKRVLPK